MTLQKGFTLVELIIVILILGILSAVAVPLYNNYQQEARQSIVNGVAGAFNSANYINVAGCNLYEGVPTWQKCMRVAKCSDLIPAVSIPGSWIGVGTASVDNVGQYFIPPVDDSIVIANGNIQTCRVQSYQGNMVYTGYYYAQGAANPLPVVNNVNVNNP